jgi:hypothetical protein
MLKVLNKLTPKSIINVRKLSTVATAQQTKDILEQKVQWTVMGNYNYLSYLCHTNISYLSHINITISISFSY